MVDDRRTHVAAKVLMQVWPKLWRTGTRQCVSAGCCSGVQCGAMLSAELRCESPQLPGVAGYFLVCEAQPHALDSKGDGIEQINEINANLRRLAPKS